MFKVEVDPNYCVAAGECVKIAPTAFEQDEDGVSHVTDASSVDRATLRQAMRLCPAGAIRVSTS